MELSLLQWNVSYLEDFKAITKQIKTINPDIVCLQELTLNHEPNNLDTGKYLASHLGYHSHFEYELSSLPDGSQALMGEGIFSRYPLIHNGNESLQAGSERKYLYATISTPGGVVHVGTAHLLFHPRFQTTPHKQSMVERLIANIPPNPQPYIFVGDLNSTPRSKAFRTLRHHLKNAGPALTQKTWTTKPFEIGRFRYDQLRYRLDYILYRGSLKPSAATIVPTPLSDHLPILAKFKLS